MPFRELEQQAAAAELEADALREDLERLRASIEQLSETLELAERDRDASRSKVRKAHLQLDEARALADQLGAELALAHLEAADLRRALGHTRSTAEARGRLIDDIVAAPAWRRRAAIRRAERVQALLSRG